jgi:hypothetical protein
MSTENEVTKKIASLEENNDVAGLEEMKNDAEVSFDGETVGLAEQAITRLNTKVEEITPTVETTESQKTKIENLDGNKNDLQEVTAPVDEKIAETDIKIKSIETETQKKIEAVVGSEKKLDIENSTEIKDAINFLDQENKISQDLLNEQGFQTLMPEARKFKSYNEHYGTQDKESNSYHLEERIKKFIQLNSPQNESEEQTSEKEKNLMMAVEYRELQDHPYYIEQYNNLSFKDFKKQEPEILSKVRFFDATRNQESRIEKENKEEANKTELIKKYLEDPQTAEKIKSGEIFFDSNTNTPLILEKLIEKGAISPSNVAESLKRYAEEQLKKSKSAGFRSSMSDSEAIQDTIKSQLVHNFGDQLPVNLVKQIIEAGNFQNIFYNRIENDISRHNTGKLYKHVGYQSNLKKASEFITDPSQKQKFKEKFGQEPSELYISEMKQDLENAFNYPDTKENPDITGTFFAGRSFSHKMDGYFDELFKNQIAPREKIMEALTKSVEALKFAEDRKFNSDVPDRNSKIREVIKLNQDGFITDEEKSKLLNP